MAKDGGLDVRHGHPELAVAGAIGLLEHRGADAGDDLPVAVEVVDVAIRDAAAQMGVNVLQVLRLGAVDVAREVEVEVVLRVADLRQRDHARVAGHFGQAREGVHDHVEVLGAEAVLVAVFDEALGGIDHEDALAGGGVFLVEHEDAGRDARAVEQIRRQADDALDVAAPDDLAADGRFRAAPEEDAVGEIDGRFARALEAGEDVEHKSEITVLLGRNAELEAVKLVVVGIQTIAPRLGGERRIGDHEIEGLEQPGLGVFEMRGGEHVVLPDFRRDAIVENHVHPGQRGGGVVHFLAVDRQVVASGALGFVVGLEQEGAGAGRRIVDGLAGTLGAAHADDLGHDAGHLRRGVELALALARLCGEVAHEEFVGVAQEVIALGAVGAEVERLIVEDGDEVGEAVHHLLALAEFVGVVEVGRLVGHEEIEVVGLGQGADDLVDLVADFLVALEPGHVGEAAAFGNLDNRVGLAGVLVGDVLHEEQREDVVLVLRGVHAAAQFVATGPEGGVEFGFLEGHG